MINRRDALKVMALGGSAMMVPKVLVAGENKVKSSFRFCLNTSTISGNNPGIEEYVRIAGEAGYDGIEVWVRDVKAYLEQGGSAESLGRKIIEAGLQVEDAIGFAPWLAKGEEGLVQMKEEMEMLAAIGCKRIAAPPAGLPDEELDLFYAGKRYKEILDLGRETGVMPQLEFWGASSAMWHLGQVLMVAAVANDADARILPDIFHLFRGGSGFEGLKMLNGNLIEIFHMNDYPAEPSAELQKDADRVYPGDGVAPVKQILRDLAAMGGEKVLSLELFNRGYWKQDPLKVAKTGLEKMKRLVSGE